MQGGGEGQPGRFTVVRAGASEELVIDKETAFALSAGDVVCVETGGGGGWGDPSQRSLELIQRDLDAEYMTPAAARAHYGVEIDASGKARRQRAS